MKDETREVIERAEVLMEALPYIRRFQGSTFVIKYGGRAMEAADLKDSFAQDVVMLSLVGIKVVVVHGGGPQISELMEQMGIKARFVRGLRVTDEKTMELVEMVLQRINKELVVLISRHGGAAVGLSGKDAGLMKARKLRVKVPSKDGKLDTIDVGLVGEVTKVNPDVIHTLHRASFIPVIAPVGCDDDGVTYNINADSAAGRIAGALGAEKLILMTDVEGIRDKDGKLISTLPVDRARRLIAQGVISEGMIPKVECCIEALREGVTKTHIIDGRVRHAALLEIFTRAGIGTEVISSSAARNNRSTSAAADARDGKAVESR